MRIFNIILTLADISLLPAMILYLFRKKTGKSFLESMGFGPVSSCIVVSAGLFFAARLVLLPLVVTDILTPHFDSRFYTIAATITTLIIIGVIHFGSALFKKKGIKKPISIEVTQTGGDVTANYKNLTYSQIIILTASCILYAAAVILCTLTEYIKGTFEVDIGAILYTVTRSLKGSAVPDIILEFISSHSAIFGVMAIMIYIVLVRRFLFGPDYGSELIIVRMAKRCRTIDIANKFCSVLLVISVVSLLLSGVYAERRLHIGDYMIAKKSPTTLYEDYYVDPLDVEITGSGKNIIYIYLESMETTYASETEGGWQEENNYIPELTELAEKNISFSNTKQLGGFRPVSGTTWTMGSLFASTSGLPFSFPIGKNNFNNYDTVASGVTSLGEILEQKGYQNEFLCGSDADFAGRKDYFVQHGNYKIFDLETAREAGYIPDDYFVWWGYEDEILYKIAKDELLELAKSEKPFNFTMLTVDTHHVDGYICNLCGQEYEGVTENVVSCADRQVAEFVEWCTEQEFYENTLIVISGDHPRMDRKLVKGVNYPERTVYNCFINCELPARSTEREFTAMDMFPTVLAAMGFQIEGDRLGIGVNLFSDSRTLCEELGFDVLDDEINKYSEYYIERFS